MGKGCQIPRAVPYSRFDGDLHLVNILVFLYVFWIGIPFSNRFMIYCLINDMDILIFLARSWYVIGFSSVYRLRKTSFSCSVKGSMSSKEGIFLS